MLLNRSSCLSRTAASRSRQLRVAPVVRSPTGRASTVGPRPLGAVKDAEQITGLLFEPFSAVQSELATVSQTDASMQSFARTNFDPACEAALNEQINVEYNISYVYHSLYAYFDRDNVGLPGMAKFFKENSAEEREHAELLMQYQNTRGGRVKLSSIILPEMEYGDDQDKGEALYALELALALEKLNFNKLRQLVQVAVDHKDDSMADFVKSQLLVEQVKSVKAAAERVSQLRRVGKGLGVFLFDRKV